MIWRSNESAWSSLPGSDFYSELPVNIHCKILLAIKSQLVMSGEMRTVFERVSVTFCTPARRLGTTSTCKEFLLSKYGIIWTKILPWFRCNLKISMSFDSQHVGVYRELQLPFIWLGSKIIPWNPLNILIYFENDLQLDLYLNVYYIKWAACTTLHMIVKIRTCKVTNWITARGNKHNDVITLWR